MLNFIKTNKIFIFVSIAVSLCTLGAIIYLYKNFNPPELPKVEPKKEYSEMDKLIILQSVQSVSTSTLTSQEKREVLKKLQIKK